MLIFIYLWSSQNRKLVPNYLFFLTSYPLMIHNLRFRYFQGIQESISEIEERGGCACWSWIHQQYLQYHLVTLYVFLILHSFVIISLSSGNELAKTKTLNQICMQNYSIGWQVNSHSEALSNSKFASSSFFNRSKQSSPYWYGNSKCVHFFFIILCRLIGQTNLEINFIVYKLGFI